MALARFIQLNPLRAPVSRAVGDSPRERLPRGYPEGQAAAAIWRQTLTVLKLAACRVPHQNGQIHLAELHEFG